MADIKNNKLLVAAIDFGTTYSGWAFSFRHDYKADPSRISVKQWFVIKANWKLKSLAKISTILIILKYSLKLHYAADF